MNWRVWIRGKNIHKICFFLKNNFFIYYLAAPGPSLGHCRGGSHSKVHWEPRGEAGSLSPAFYLTVSLEVKNLTEVIHSFLWVPSENPDPSLARLVSIFKPTKGSNNLKQSFNFIRSKVGKLGERGPLWSHFNPL